MIDFKFLSENEQDSSVLIPTDEEIARALNIGRQAYLNGHPIEYNPYIRQELYTAFDEGWDLEHSYDLLRQAQQSANNNSYEEGWESARSGHPLNSNPYLPDTTDRTNWFNGWNAFVDSH